MSKIQKPIVYVLKKDNHFVTKIGTSKTDEYVDVVNNHVIIDVYIINKPIAFSKIYLPIN